MTKNEDENIKKMLANSPYSHDGMTEYDGLPPMSPHPNVKPGKKVDWEKMRKHQELVRNFVENLDKQK